MRRIYLVVLVIAILVLPSCAQPPETLPPTETIPPAPTPPPDTTPPSAISGLVVVNAYDGRVNLWWDKSTAEDFDHYNIYLDKAEMVGVTGMTPVQQIKNIANNTYQATGLEDGTRYYFAVTAVDKNGNESTKVTGVSATPVPMPRGTKDPDLIVDVYQPDKVWAGTTLLPLNYGTQLSRIVEVNMLGEIVWQYIAPKFGVNMGVEAELLPNNNILYTLGGSGVFEIDRSGKVVWQYLTSKADHDADRLPNGNTIFVFGCYDQKSDAQVTEVNSKGEVVWSWHAIDHFNRPPFNEIDFEGFVHTNAVSRLTSGNTLISLRNFNFVVEVDPKGEVVRTIGEGILDDQHDPEILPNGNLLAAQQNLLPQDRQKPQAGIEIDPKTGKVVWSYPMPGQLVRDANRLPNGNTLITGGTEIVEVTPQGEIVWRLILKGEIKDKYMRDGFYKADRIGIAAP